MVLFILLLLLNSIPPPAPILSMSQLPAKTTITGELTISNYYGDSVLIAKLDILGKNRQRFFNSTTCYFDTTNIYYIGGIARQKITIGNKNYYISEKDLNTVITTGNSSPIVKKKVKLAEEAYKQKQIERKREKEREKEIIKLYGTTNGNLINNHYIKIGFTKEMVIDSWGFPDSRTIYYDSSGATETLYYNFLQILDKSVTLKNGIVISYFLY